MAQWIKNPTAALRVAWEVQVQSQDQGSGLRDPQLPQLRGRLQVELGFDPWPGNFHTLRVHKILKKKRKKLEFQL